MFQGEKTSLFYEFVHNEHELKIDWLLKRLFVNFISAVTKTSGRMLNDFAEGKTFTTAAPNLTYSYNDLPRPEKSR